MPTSEIIPFKVATPVREIVLDLASSKEGLREDNFVVLAPPKKGKLDALHFSDGKAIRRTIGITNQLVKQEIIQMCAPGSDTPKYKLGDPQNCSGLPGFVVHPNIPAIK